MSEIAEGEQGMGFLRRLWIYQRERFPLGRTALLLLVFSAASISLSAHLAGRDLPAPQTFATIWVAVVLTLVTGAQYFLEGGQRIRAS